MTQGRHTGEEHRVWVLPWLAGNASVLDQERAGRAPKRTRHVPSYLLPQAWLCCVTVRAVDSV